MPQFECRGETRASDRNRGKGFILLKRDPRGEHGDVGALRVWALGAEERKDRGLPGKGDPELRTALIGSSLIVCSSGNYRATLGYNL